LVDRRGGGGEWRIGRSPKGEGGGKWRADTTTEESISGRKRRRRRAAMAVWVLLASYVRFPV
jgi:hypothetical protein